MAANELSITLDWALCLQRSGPSQDLEPPKPKKTRAPSKAQL